MTDIELITFAVVDERQQVLLCHHRDSGEWQLPGGLLQEGETNDQAVLRHAQDKLCISVRKQQYLGSVTFREGGDVYVCDWHQATKIRKFGRTFSGDKYDRAEFHDLNTYRVAKIGLSPVVERFRWALLNGEIHLLPSDLVQ